MLWVRDRGWLAEAASTVGGGGTTVSRATEERKHLVVLKNCYVWRERVHDLKF
jgi:hypothetical protein